MYIHSICNYRRECIIYTVPVTIDKCVLCTQYLSCNYRLVYCVHITCNYRRVYYVRTQFLLISTSVLCTYAVPVTIDECTLYVHSTCYYRRVYIVRTQYLLLSTSVHCTYTVPVTIDECTLYVHSTCYYRRVYGVVKHGRVAREWFVPLQLRMPGRNPMDAQVARYCWNV